MRDLCSLHPSCINPEKRGVSTPGTWQSLVAGSQGGLGEALGHQGGTCSGFAYCPTPSTSHLIPFRHPQGSPTLARRVSE